MIGWVPWVVAWGLSGPPQLPASPPSTTDVRIEQPSEDPCPAVDAIAADLESLSGGAINVGEVAPQTVRIATTRTDAGLTLELTFIGEGGDEVRRLEVTDCATARRASALVIAVTLAPVETSSVVVERPVAPPKPITSVVEVGPTQQEPQESSDRVEDRFDATRPQPSTRRIRPERWRLAALTGPAFATAPSVSAVLGGELAVRLGPVALAARGWHVFSAADVEGGVGVRAAVSAGGVALSLPLTAGAVDVELSAGLDAGALTGFGEGERVVGRDTISPWVAATIGAGLSWPSRGRFALVARAEGAVLVARPAIALNGPEGLETEFSSPGVAARVWAGPAVRFP